MERLLRITSVDDYRAMRSWRSSADLRCFTKYNVIFGVNGSGKSTLAGLIADAGNSTRLRISVGENEEDSRTVDSPSDTFWTSVRVFDADYVRHNLRFEGDDGSSTEPLLVLGEQRVEAEEARAAALHRISEIQSELPVHERNHRDSSRTRDKLATDTARRITEELQGVSSRYSPRTYNARVVKDAIARGLRADDVTDVAADLATVHEIAPAPGNIPEQQEFSLEPILEEVRIVLALRASSQVIDDLAASRPLSDWVQTGMTLHHDQETCLFCSGPLTAARRAELEAHFDDSLRSLESRLDTVEAQLRAVEAAARASIERLPSDKELSERFRPNYAKALEDLRRDHVAFCASTQGLLEELDAKRGRLFSAETLGSSPHQLTLSLTRVAEALRDHNQYVADISNHRTEAADRVERERIVSVVADYQSFNTTAEHESQLISELTAELGNLERVVRDTNVQDLDPLPMAEKLNDDLIHLLGRDDLAFVADEGGYRIMRGGQPASHLSEGERNAISLLYFLRSLDVHNTELGACVVVIDDPVSSLDQNSLVGASALLWTRLVGNVGQLIMLTHNFELFRTWSYQLTGAASKLGEKNPFALYEVKAAYEIEGDSAVRTPLLVNWPAGYQMQKKLRSEYHYLFWTVLQTLQDRTPEGEAAAAALLPNTCRRLLEAFLAFRQPSDLGNLNEQVLRTKPDAVSPDVRQRVLRFVHTYSHNEEADISRPLARPETLDNIRAVVAFVAAIDRDHFEGMCSALEIDYPLADTSENGRSSRSVATDQIPTNSSAEPTEQLDLGFASDGAQ